MSLLSLSLSFDFCLVILILVSGGRPSSMHFILNKFAERSGLDLSSIPRPKILEVIRV